MIIGKNSEEHFIKTKERKYKYIFMNQFLQLLEKYFKKPSVG